VQKKRLWLAVDRSKTIAEEEPVGEIRRRFTLTEEDEEEEDASTSPSFHEPNKVYFYTADDSAINASDQKEQKPDIPTSSKPTLGSAHKTKSTFFSENKEPFVVREDLRPIDEESDGALSVRRR